MNNLTAVKLYPIHFDASRRLCLCLESQESPVT